MKKLCILTCAAATLIATGTAASAQMGGGDGGTMRPSYDNPRDYDRDRYGNETYYPRNTWFGPRHGYSYDSYYYGDEGRPVRKSKKKVVKKRHYNDDY